MDATTSSLLDRLFASVSDCMTPESSRRLAELQADAELQARVDLLAERCNEGTLTPEEREEYDAYVRASGFVGILQNKARRRLTASIRTPDR